MTISQTLANRSCFLIWTSINNGCNFAPFSLVMMAQVIRIWQSHLVSGFPLNAFYPVADHLGWIMMFREVGRLMQQPRGQAVGWFWPDWAATGHGTQIFSCFMLVAPSGPFVAQSGPGGQRSNDPKIQRMGGHGARDPDIPVAQSSPTIQKTNHPTIQGYKDQGANDPSQEGLQLEVRPWRGARLLSSNNPKIQGSTGPRSSSCFMLVAQSGPGQICTSMNILKSGTRWFHSVCRYLHIYPKIFELKKICISWSGPWGQRSGSPGNCRTR